MMPIGKQFLISGRVQGVFYRRFAEREAVALQLTGWVRNLDDGRVEVQAFGEETELLEYAKKLAQGPSAARVDEVKEGIIAWEKYSGFEVVS